MKRLSAFLCIAFLFSIFLSNQIQSDDRGLTITKMQAEKRIALVIGNGAYSFAPLRNPVNDANAIADALGDCNFNV